MTNRLAIITVVYNNYEILNDFFESLEKQADKNFHLFITDNSENRQKISNNRIPFTIINSKNLGYSHGVNLGLKKAQRGNFEKFCVINTDTYFEKDFTDKVSHSLDKNQNSIIGGKIYYAAGYEYHKDRYGKKDLGHVLWYAGGQIDWDNVFTKHIGVDEVDTGKYDALQKTDFITGCLMTFDKNVLNKVGYWNEKYFLYYEDADWCERAKRKGIQLLYDPSIMIWHKNSQSTGGSGSPLHQKYQNKNRLRFGLKYGPLKTKLHLLKNYFLVGLSLRINK